MHQPHEKKPRDPESPYAGKWVRFLVWGIVFTLIALGVVLVVTR
jgi:hypothetical protein